MAQSLEADVVRETEERLGKHADEDDGTDDGVRIHEFFLVLEGYVCSEAEVHDG